MHHEPESLCMSEAPRPMRVKRELAQHGGCAGELRRVILLEIVTFSRSASPAHQARPTEL